MLKNSTLFHLIHWGHILVPLSLSLLPHLNQLFCKPLLNLVHKLLLLQLKPTSSDNRRNWRGKQPSWSEKNRSSRTGVEEGLRSKKTTGHRSPSFSLLSLASTKTSVRTSQKNTRRFASECTTSGCFTVPLSSSMCWPAWPTSPQTRSLGWTLVCPSFGSSSSPPSRSSVGTGQFTKPSGQIVPSASFSFFSSFSSKWLCT